MNIGGFQKTSLLDYPGKIAAIIWTVGCNFRCPFCYNPDWDEEQMSEDNIEIRKDQIEPEEKIEEEEEEKETEEPGCFFFSCLSFFRLWL